MAHVGHRLTAQERVAARSATDKRLTAAVEQTGESPQFIVDAALAAYLDALGIG